MTRMMVVVAGIAVAGLIGCGDDDATGSSGSGGTGGSGGSATGRVADVLALTGDATAGTTVFDGSCGQANCHGSDGTASNSNARDLTTFASTITDAQLIQIIIDGSVGQNVMPPLGSQYSDQEIADVVAYVRATFP